MPNDATHLTPEVAETKQSPRPKASRFKRALVQVAIVAVLLGIAYGAGRFHASEERGAVEKVQKRVHQLEARRQLHIALMALEDRNFGTAQKTLSQAGAELAQATPTDDTQFSEEVANYKFMAGEDISKERQNVLAMVVRLDKLLSEQVP